MQKERRTSIASSFLDIDKKQAPPPKKEQQEGIASKEEEEEEEEEEELTDQQKKQLKELEEEMEIGFRYFPGKIRFPNDEKNKWTPVFVGGALRRVEDRDAGIGDWTRKVHRHLQWAKQQEGLKGYSQKLEEFWEEIKKRFREKGIEVMDTIDLKDPKSIEKYKGQFQVHEQEKVPLTEPLRVRAVGFRALTGCSLHDVYDRPFKNGQLITIYGMMHCKRKGKRLSRFIRRTTIAF